MEICEYNHEQICHDQGHNWCPLCKANEEIENLKDDIYDLKEDLDELNQKLDKG